LGARNLLPGTMVFTGKTPYLGKKTSGLSKRYPMKRGAIWSVKGKREVNEFSLRGGGKGSI